MHDQARRGRNIVSIEPHASAAGLFIQCSATSFTVSHRRLCIRARLQLIEPRRAVKGMPPPLWGGIPYTSYLLMTPLISTATIICLPSLIAVPAQAPLLSFVSGETFT